MRGRACPEMFFLRPDPVFVDGKLEWKNDNCLIWLVISDAGVKGAFVNLKLNLALSVILLVLPTEARTAELAVDKIVSFDLPHAPLTLLERQRLGARAVMPAQGSFAARLRVPKANKKVPAVVAIHTCHNPSYYDPWLKRLSERGFATLSFSRCQPPDNRPDAAVPPSLDWKRGASAAMGALRYLASRPEINPNAIALLAWSRPAMTSLSVLNLEGFSQFFKIKYTAAVALYPFCSFARGPHGGPILVISAGKDDWVDTNVCVRMGANTSRDRYPIQVVVIPDVHHGFDIEAHGPPHRAARAEINPDGYAAGSGTLGYNGSAANRAIEIVFNFLTNKLLR